MLTISNFDNIISPDTLDLGKKIIQKKGVKNLSEEEKGEWVGQVKDAEDSFDVFVRMGKNQIVHETFCTCPEFAALMHLEAGDETACSHSAAVLFRIRTKLMGAPELAHGKREKGKPAGKDASLKLLESLDPAKITDFVKIQLAKDLGFKSQFMLHFSAHEVVDEIQYKNIITNAIKNVKGRKRYLTAGDGSKITQSLTPLLDQATQAESKRHYREAHAITKLFLQEVLPLSTTFKTESVRFAKFVERIREVWFLLAQSKNSPPDFQAEFYEELKSDFLKSYKDRKDPFRSLHFKAFIHISKATEQLDAVETILKEDIQAELSNKNIKHIDVIYCVLFLADFLEKVKEDKTVLIKHLETYKKYDDVFIRLMETLLATDKAKEASQEIDALLKTVKTPKSQHHFTRTPEFWDLQYKIFIEAERGNDAADMAQTCFIESNYTEFDFYEKIKNAVSAAEWEKREQTYIKETQAATRSHKKQEAFFKMLELGFHYKMLYGNLLKKGNFYFLLNFSSILKQDKPDEYLGLVKKMMQKALGTTKNPAKKLDPDLVKVFEGLVDMPNGPALQKVLAKKMDLDVSPYLRIAKKFLEKK